MHAQHFDKAVSARTTFLYAGVEGVAVEVVEAVHVELAADQLMKKRPLVGASKHFNGQIELAAKLLIQSLHQKQRELLVGHILKNGRFQGVGERAVSHVVQQNGG